MITVRVVTPKLTKDKSFEDHAKANTWAKQIYTAIGRESEFRERKLAGATIVIHAPFSIRELHEKGISFFGATTVER